jgi:preprotein translocase subunit SecD
VNQESGARGLFFLGGILVLLAAIAVYFTVYNPVTRYIREGLDLKGGVRVVLQTVHPPAPGDMAKVQAIMLNRADGLGVSEPIVQQQGTNQVVVELPGVKNQEAAIKQLQTTGLLQFEGPSTNTKTPGPDGKPFVTGRDLESAQATILSGTGGGPAVDLTFNAAGAAAMSKFTASHIGQLMYVLLDNKIIETATVQSEISANGQITGLSSVQQAQQLATLLNAGALPVPLKTVEIQTVSATLGADSVRASEAAGLLAMILIGAFMIFFYRFAGVLADMALALYLMVLVAVLIGIGNVFTLPGVAGMILSAGIAVDANVIIFARIRDELRAGRGIGSAIDFGFRNAFRAIADSNVSAIVAAIVLYEFGIGDVRGFALTLAIGVAISFVTAYFFTRVLIRLAEGTRMVQNLNLFVGYRPPAPAVAGEAT